MQTVKVPPSCNAANGCSSMCVFLRDRGKMLTRHWPLVGMWRQLILQHMGWLKGDFWCVCVYAAAALSPRRLPKPSGPSSAQVKHSDKVVPALASWEEKPPFIVVWSLISMVWKTDVFYVEKYTFHSMECLHWQGILTDIMVAVFHCYYTVNITSVLAKFW